MDVIRVDGCVVWERIMKRCSYIAGRHRELQRAAQAIGASKERRDATSFLGDTRTPPPPSIDHNTISPPTPSRPLVAITNLDTSRTVFPNDSWNQLQPFATCCRRHRIFNTPARFNSPAWAYSLRDACSRLDTPACEILCKSSLGRIVLRRDMRPSHAPRDPP